LFARIATAIRNLKVVDASALAAVLFGEPDSPMIEERLEDATLLASDLLDYEIANIAVKKWRKQEMLLDELYTALRAREDIIVTLLNVDFEAAFNLAIQAKLTAYDASYLWLARQYDAELVTLDKELQAAFLSPAGR
jgi:predicted nucleic acid-binding protein